MDFGYSALSTAAPPLPAPEDGIVASQRPKGQVARRWEALLAKLPEDRASRLSRGTSLARAGRVRGLWFRPGKAHAEVIGSEVNSASIEVRDFSPAEWQQVYDVLLSNLRYVAALLEGELTTALVDELAQASVSLVPDLGELEFDCNCSDFMMPCCHATALHHVLADAVDGEPFVLFTLRGRDRDHVLSDLRRAWGDDRPVREVAQRQEEEPPHVADPYSHGSDLPDLKFAFREAKTLAAGLRALGPAPGNADLLHALSPLYAAGAEAAVAIAHAEPDENAMRRRRRRRSRDMVDVVVDSVEISEEPPSAPPSEPSKELTADDLIEEIVNRLSEQDDLSLKEMAVAIGVSIKVIRPQVEELEELGLLIRASGSGAKTRWALG
jgi:uncharacterized Zn finger protein